MKKYSYNLTIKEMKTKTTLRFHFTIVKMGIIKTNKQTTINDKDVGEEEHLHTVGRNLN
jgi:hypothetical protein